MFSGKTEELIKQLKEANLANQKTLIVKPKIDSRYEKNKIVSHNNTSLDCMPIDSSKEIIKLVQGVKVVGIDEAQFFDSNITDVCQKLIDKGIQVIVAGLDMDYKKNPFGQMPNLLSMADKITKLRAECHNCGQPANFSYRISEENNQQIMLGEKKEYEARCRNCYDR